MGSFFDFRPTEGAFEANPPFVRDVILKMANHMDYLLKVSAVRSWWWWNRVGTFAHR